MRYLGEEKVEVAFRYVEYLRCDYCNKKIYQDERYYEVVEHNSGDYYWEKDICLDCIKSFFKDKTFYDNDELSIHKTKLYRQPVNTRDGTDEYCLVEEDKGE